MTAGAPRSSIGSFLPDSIVTWRFLANGGDSWGGTLIADTGLHAAGDTIAGAFGAYTILQVEDRGLDLSAFGLEDGQVFVDWYWDVQTAQFLATRNGAGTAAGAAGLGSEQDFAWTGLAWMAFGMQGAQQADASVVAANARFSWVFEANSGDRWGGWLFDLGSRYDSGAIVTTAHGRYRITGEESLHGGESVAAGSVRLTGSYGDSASLRQFSISGADGFQEHGDAGLGSETGQAWNGADWVTFGQGGALQADPPPGPRLALTEFGFVAGGWSSNNQYPRGAGDVNGDGRADIFGFGAGGMWVALADGAGGFGTPYLAVENFGVEPSAGGWSDSDSFPRSVADVNGDGRADIIGFGSGGVWVSLANAGGGFEPMRLVVDNFGVVPAAGGWVSSERFPRTMADVNGDGRADLVGFGNAGVWISLAKADGRFEPMRLAVGNFGAEPQAGGWTSNDRFPRQLADVDGDGLADIVGFGAGGVWLARADGHGGFEPMRLAVANFGADAVAGGWTSNDRFPRGIADVNGDGRADVFGFGLAGVWVAYGNVAGGFEAQRLAFAGFGNDPSAGGWTSQDRFPRVVADVGGDGRADLVGFGADGVWIADGHLLG